jgi:hypothetical protein
VDFNPRDKIVASSRRKRVAFGPDLHLIEGNVHERVDERGAGRFQNVLFAV